MGSLHEWTDLHYFLELARTGTLSGTARRLGVEHTTVARHIDRLETEFSTSLFDRRRDGYRLTEAGQALLPHAEAMEGVALTIVEQLGGARVAASGKVRLGAPEVFGTSLITPRLPQLYAKHPGLQLELLLPHRFPNLANREADLLVTLDAPTNGRYVVSRLTELVYYLYASPAYLDRHPPIVSRADLAGHDFIDYVQDQLMSNDLRYLEALTTAPTRRFSCTGMMAQYEAAVAGLGLAMMPPYAARNDGRLRQVLAGEVGESRTLWIAAPADLYRLTRVRVVWNFVREMVEQMPELFHLPSAAAATERTARDQPKKRPPAIAAPLADAGVQAEGSPAQ